MSFTNNFVIGKTRSSKIFRCYEFENIMEFFDVLYNETIEYTQIDLFDTYCMLEYMVQREIRKHSSDSEKLLLYGQYLEFIAKRLDAEFFEVEKQRLNLKTSIDICNFGSKMVAIEFKHF